MEDATAQKKYSEILYWVLELPLPREPYKEPALLTWRDEQNMFDAMAEFRERDR